MTEDAARAISQADAFHKNVALMFEDIHSSIQEKGLPADLIFVNGPEFNYTVWNSKILTLTLIDF